MGAAKRRKKKSLEEVEVEQDLTPFFRVERKKID